MVPDTLAPLFATTARTRRVSMHRQDKGYLSFSVERRSVRVLLAFTRSFFFLLFVFFFSVSRKETLHRKRDETEESLKFAFSDAIGSHGSLFGRAILVWKMT